MPRYRAAPEGAVGLERVRMIRRHLEDPENRIDPDVERELLSEWKVFLDGGLNAGFFSPRRRRPSPAAAEWREISVNRARDSLEQMPLTQLSGCSAVRAWRVVRFRSPHSTPWY